MHRTLITFLYIITVVVALYLIAVGSDYYFISGIDKPHHPLHQEWKPGGFVGHGLGIVGSLLVVILFLYSARKRFRFMLKWGNIRYWLNIHIWMGVTGPLLVIFHTCFKVGGIVAISFWSMIAVALSGVLGRYIYLQIPRSLDGKELSLSEISDRESRLVFQLQEDYKIKPATMQSIRQITRMGEYAHNIGWSVIWRWILSDIRIPMTVRNLRKTLRQDEGFSRSDANGVLKLSRSLAILKRRVVFLKPAQNILHYWHLIHEPFAIVMVVFMIIHVIIAVMFGSTWVF